ncbi:MAG: glycosyltransferase family 4 protein [Candidatus Brocadiaceae bacterium]|nr:glycosyltransferase family 4 protein [Candidatus Brocadiaceae bacterium]
MKIALVYPKYTTHGGTERFIFNFSRQLLDMGHEVHLVVGKVDGPVDRRTIVHKVPIIKLGKFLKVLSFLLFSQRILKKYQFDIVQGFGRTIKQDVFRAGGGCHKEYRKHVLKKIRNPLLRYFKLYQLRQLLILYTEKKQFSQGNYKKIAAVSNRVKKEIVSNYGVPEADIEVIYNGVDTETFHPQNKERYGNEIRKIFNIKSDEKVILFLGTGFERKGLTLLMHACAIIKDSHPDTKLLVVGKDNNVQKHVRLSRELGISNRVIFTGPQSDVKRFYAASDIFVFPTLYEPFGNVCLEAMASGLPVITSRLNGASEIMEEMEYLLLSDPTDITSLSEKIMFLLTNTTDRMKIAVAVRKIAERYTISRNALEFINLYTKLFDKKSYEGIFIN